MLVGERFPQVVELQVDDLADLVLAETVEDDGLVDSVEQFGPELGFERLADSAAQFVLVLLAGELGDPLAADVAGHDDDGVLEVDGAAVPVGEASFVEDL